MSFEEQFDKIINNKINESAFPFDEKNWEKASALIDANRIIPIAKNKSKSFLLLSLAFLTVITIGVFTYLQLNTNTVVATNSAKNKTTISENLTTKINNKSNSTSVNNNDENPTNTLNGLNTESEKTGGNNINNEKKYKNEAILNTNSNTLKKDNNPTNQINFANEENVNINPTNKIDTNEAPTLASNETQKDVASSKLMAIKNYNNSTTPKKLGAIITANKLLQKNNATISSKINPIIISTKNNISTNSELSNEAHSNKIEDNENIKPNFEPLTTITLNVQQDLKEYECKTTNVNFLQAYDNDYFKNTKPKFNYLNLEAGATYLFGFNTSNTKDAVGINYYAGLNYGIYLSKKISVSTGLQFYNIGNIKQSFYTASQTVYEFGSTGSYTNITTNSLYYISVPLKLNFALSPISKIGLGLNTGFLVGGKNTLETYNLFDGVKANATTTTNKGYYEGVNTKNVVLSAFYTHKLNKRFSVNGEFMYGISDVYTNTKTNSTKQNTLGFKLGLTFTLFDK